jgi:hypothetical protein
MVRVEISNFQSMVREVIEIDGFSTVVGRSNIGKSAMVRAIKAALTGAPADSYVRHQDGCSKVTKGAKSCKCYCSVRIIGDGVDLLWEKGDTVNRYVYNGVEHTVVGRGTPEFLGSEFGLVSLGSGDKTLLQVSDQFTPLFLLDKSGTVVADVLSDVAKLDQINVAARMAEKDRKEAASTRKIREKDLVGLRAILAQYDSLDAIIERARSVEALGEKVDTLEARTFYVTGLAETLKTAILGVKALSGVGDLVMPSWPPVEARIADIRTLGRLQRELTECRAAVDSLSGFDVPLPEISSFLESGKEFVKLGQWFKVIDGLKAFFAKAAGLDTATLPDLGSVVEKHVSFNRLGDLRARQHVTQSALDKLEQDLSDTLEAEELVLTEFRALGVCPTCRQSVHAPSHKHQGVIHA